MIEDEYFTYKHCDANQQQFKMILGNSQGTSSWWAPWLPSVDISLSFWILNWKQQRAEKKRNDGRAAEQEKTIKHIKQREIVSPRGSCSPSAEDLLDEKLAIQHSSREPEPRRCAPINWPNYAQRAKLVILWPSNGIRTIQTAVNQEWAAHICKSKRLAWSNGKATEQRFHVGDMK